MERVREWELTFRRRQGRLSHLDARRPELAGAGQDRQASLLPLDQVVADPGELCIQMVEIDELARS